MVKGFGLVALFLATEAAFLFHVALPAGIPASAPRGRGAVTPVVRSAEPAPPAPRAAAAPPCPCPCERTRC
ncbi:MAG: hypothetical protein ACJ79R_12940 [Anaeromyxobacteraceae bacterium]